MAEEYEATHVWKIDLESHIYTVILAKSPLFRGGEPLVMAAMFTLNERKLITTCPTRWNSYTREGKREKFLQVLFLPGHIEKTTT